MNKQSAFGGKQLSKQFIVKQQIVLTPVSNLKNWAALRHIFGLATVSTKIYSVLMYRRIQMLVWERYNTNKVLGIRCHFTKRYYKEG